MATKFRSDAQRKAIMAKLAAGGKGFWKKHGQKVGVAAGVVAYLVAGRVAKGAVFRALARRGAPAFWESVLAKPQLSATPAALKMHRKLAAIAGVPKSDLRGIGKFMHRKGLKPNAAARGPSVAGYYQPRIQADVPGAVFMRDYQTATLAVRKRPELYIRLGAGGLPRMGMNPAKFRKSVLRHEIGHNMYARISPQMRAGLNEDLLKVNRAHVAKYGSYQHYPNESFAETYRKHRRTPYRSIKRKTKKVKLERHILAQALADIRRNRL